MLQKKSVFFTKKLGLKDHSNEPWKGSTCTPRSSSLDLQCIVRFDPSPRRFVSRTCVFCNIGSNDPWDKVTCKKINNTSFLSKKLIFDFLLVHKEMELGSSFYRLKSVLLGEKKWIMLIKARAILWCYHIKYIQLYGQYHIIISYFSIIEIFECENSISVNFLTKVFNNII